MTQQGAPVLPGVCFTASFLPRLHLAVITPRAHAAPAARGGAEGAGGEAVMVVVVTMVYALL
ncbi:hypothetical protein E2C01_066968 [Portunus trituberculatus]|uniref:Uncharacterized protein n=1 Tax=Portunus trituberculatus TaxID=210409 RepID=A0A5B7HS69_PORTR|nr:hypothetical protein [Portunus trituberculatus]